MNIAVIGAGNVGGTLGSRWAQAGHTVVFGVKNAADPKLPELLQKSGANASAKTVAEAAAGAEIVVFATPWPATQDAIKTAGDLKGKIVLDCTNPLKPDMSGLELGLTTSAGEKVAEWAVGARVVKIFNTTGFPNMANPDFGGQAATMFYCGDDADAKSKANQLAADLGFDPIDAGPLTQARTLEPLAMLWISMAFGGMGTNMAFKLLRR